MHTLRRTGMRLPAWWWGALLVALNSLPTSAQELPAPAADASLLVGDLLRVTPPPGWQATLVAGQGAVLKPPDANAWPVEIALWPVPEGAQATPAAAAAAQETALFRLAPYARTSQRDFTTRDGRAGLTVFGQMKGADGQVRDSVFIAFAEGGKFVVLGTFAEAGQGPAAAAGEFDTIARSLVFVAPPPPPAELPAAPVAPTPATVPGDPVKPAMPAPTPVTTPGDALPTLPPALPAPAAPAPTAPAAPTPAGPSPQPAVPAAETTKTSPGREITIPPVTPAATPGTTSALTASLNFRLQVPADWQVRVTDGRVEATAPPAAGTAPDTGVFCWLWGGLSPEAEPLRLARQCLEGWDLVGANAAGLAGRTVGRQGYLAGTLGPGAAPRRFVACCAISGDTALLSGFYCPPESFATRAPELVKILASFAGGPWWGRASDTKPRPAAGLWTDPDYGVLQVPVPAGWRLKGKLARVNGQWTIALEGVDEADRRCSFAWYQPLQPFYHELTPVLVNLGWREGDRYSSNPGETPARVLNRLEPEEALRRQVLAQGPGQLADVQVEGLPSPEAAQLLTGANASGASYRLQGTSNGAVRERYCLVAVADAPEPADAGSWQIAVLQAEGPTGAGGTAAEVLRGVVAGAGVGPGSPGVPVATVQDLLRRAQTALRALPEPAPRPEGAFPVLAHLTERGTGGLWLVPPLGLDCWQRLARLEGGLTSGGLTMPELAPDFWK